MFLYIIRHAWAAEPDADEFPDDSLRPLTAKGRKRFRRLVERLVASGFEPRHMATSPLVRCRETAGLVADVLPRRPSLAALDDLAPNSRLDPLLAWAAEQPPGDMAWVGHAPDVGELTAALIGDATAAIGFSKGTVAAIEFDRRPARGLGELRWLATADLLDV